MPLVESECGRLLREAQAKLTAACAWEADRAAVCEDRERLIREVERLRVERQEDIFRLERLRADAFARAEKAEAEVEEKDRDWAGIYAHDMAQVKAQREKAEAALREWREAESSPDCIACCTLDAALADNVSRG
jgi:hypothetical protein